MEIGRTKSDHLPHIPAVTREALIRKAFLCRAKRLMEAPTAPAIAIVRTGYNSVAPA